MKNEKISQEKKKIIKNPVQNRFLPLSASVALGLEPEPKITDFKIKHEIGSGSFGRVYLASHLKTKVDYAIKVIDKRNKTNIEGKPYFHREIEIMSKIRHPNCVRLFGNFEDDNFCYFIMEYIPGGNLYTLMSNNRNTGLNIYLVANIVRDLASAIYYLHNMNPPIIHRDIKPENVLLTKNSKIKLTDFGWSNYIDFEGEQRSTICGTPIYLAPEMIQNSGHDKHVDIWCLGVLLFELLTGTPPFIGQNRNLLMKNIINVNIVWPSKPRLPIDPDAKDLISKILKKKPNERISLENMIKHNFFIKYCPNIKPFFDQRQKFHSKPFIISKDIPNDNDLNYDYDSIDNNYEQIEHDKNKKILDIRHILRTSEKKNKIREITPEPSAPNFCLDYKKKIKVNYNLEKYSRQNSKKRIKLYQNVEEELKKTLKEKEELQKEIENYKLRETGYIKKIEELAFALNNLNQENILLKLDLEKQKKDLDKRKKEINKLRTNRNLNLNLNNQTTYNINTTTNSNINEKDNDINIDIGNGRKKKNVISRNFISKTPEVLQRKKNIILTKNSYMKPYLKKNALLSKNSTTIITIDNGAKKEENNNSEKKESFSDITDINNNTNKNIKYNKYNNLELNTNNEMNEKERYRILIKQLKRENESLKNENKKYKNRQINIQKLSNKGIDDY